MTREHAVRRLRKLFGDKACWRVAEGVSSPERRETAKAEADRLDGEMEALDREIAAREVAAGIPALRQRRRELRQDRERQMARASFRKFTVGKNQGWCFEVVADGDTWEEAIERAEGKQVPQVLEKVGA